LKLSATHNVKTIIPPVENFIDAISINSVPWNIIYPNKESPLQHLGGGGVSGKIAQEINWNFMQEIINISDIPVIAPSIWDTKDIETTKTMGAKAFSFGTRFLLTPWIPNQIISSQHQRN
jgi:dihydroorotate dehydrogenase